SAVLARKDLGPWRDAVMRQSDLGPGYGGSRVVDNRAVDHSRRLLAIRLRGLRPRRRDAQKERDYQPEADREGGFRLRRRHGFASRLQNAALQGFIAFCRASALQSRPDLGRGRCLQSLVPAAREALAPL